MKVKDNKEVLERLARRKAVQEKINKLEAKIRTLEFQKSIAKAPLTRAAVEKQIRKLETKKAALMKKLAA